jgi:hypothetical protein
MLFGVAPRVDTKKTCLIKEIGLHVENMRTNLDSIISIIEGDLCDRLMNMGFITWMMGKINS